MPRRFLGEDPARAGSNWFVYGNNNPLRFTDPTGLDAVDFYNALRSGGYNGPKVYWGSYTQLMRQDHTPPQIKATLSLTFNKATQTMSGTFESSVEYKASQEGYKNEYVKREIDIPVDPNVVRGAPDSQKNEDPDRTQTILTDRRPTQMPNGVWEITGYTEPQDARFGDRWIKTNASQMVNTLDGGKVADFGYNFHLTPLRYTDGCGGLRYDPGSPLSRTNTQSDLDSAGYAAVAVMNTGGTPTITVTSGSSGTSSSDYYDR